MVFVSFVSTAWLRSVIILTQCVMIDMGFHQNSADEKKIEARKSYVSRGLLKTKYAFFYCGSCLCFGRWTSIWTSFSGLIYLLVFLIVLKCIFILAFTKRKRKWKEKTKFMRLWTMNYEVITHFPIYGCRGFYPKRTYCCVNLWTKSSREVWQHILTNNQ